MPLITVYDIEYDEVNQKLIAGTFARSLQSIDVSTLLIGLKENKMSTSVSVYPNPVSDVLFFNYNSLTNYVPCTIKVIDMKGSIVLTTQTIIQSNNAVSVNTLNKGNYILNLQVGNKNLVTKFVKN
jgi:hypothetical protein